MNAAVARALAALEAHRPAILAKPLRQRFAEDPKRFETFSLSVGDFLLDYSKNLVDADLMNGQPELLIYGMLASLLAAGTWLLVASRKGWPVSTTHSIVGAIVGFAAVGIGIDAVQWGKVGTIVMSWVVSPLTAGFIAFLIYLSVQRLILRHKDPLDRAKRYVPVYMFLAAFTITLVTILKGLSHVGLTISLGDAYLLAFAIAFGIAVDDSIHFINRYMLESRRWPDTRSALAAAMSETGQAMIITTVLISCGLLVTLFSEFHTIRLFGGMLIATLLTALLGDLLLLPSLIAWRKGKA